MRQILHIRKVYETFFSATEIYKSQHCQKRKLRWRNYSCPKAFEGHQLLDNASDISPHSQVADSLVWQKKVFDNR